MNPVERVIRRVDMAQQRHKVPAFVVGVLKKYGDDNGGALAANLAYAAFVSVFPLLLILVTVLVEVASQSPALRAEVLEAVSNQFPVVGSKLVGSISALHRSSVASLVAGLLILGWGATRLAQAGLFAMAQVWNVPGPARPGYLPRLGRATAFLGVLAVGLVISTLLASLVTYGHHAVGLRMLAQVLAALANVALYLTIFRVLTPKAIPGRQLVPGAVAGGAAWTVLLGFGAFIVHRDLHTASLYGIFATVLLLVAWIYLAVQVTVYAAEVNVVLARRLWPRTIVQPPLAEADRASMALQALQNQRRPEQTVEVSFTDRPPGIPAPARTPRTPGEVLPPGRRAVREAGLQVSRGTEPHGGSRRDDRMAG